MIFSDYASSNKPISYLLFGIIDNPPSRFQISTQPKIFKDGSDTDELPLPELDAIEVQISDVFGEINTISQRVDVKKQEGKSWFEILTLSREKNKKENSTDPQFILWQIYNSVGTQANQAAVGGTADYDDVVDVNKLII